MILSKNFQVSWKMLKISTMYFHFKTDVLNSSMCSCSSLSLQNFGMGLQITEDDGLKFEVMV